MDTLTYALDIGDYVSVPLCLLSFLGGVHSHLDKYTDQFGSAFKLAFCFVLFAAFSILHDLLWLIGEPEEGAVLFKVKSWGKVLCTR